MSRPMRVKVNTAELLAAVLAKQPDAEQRLADAEASYAKLDAEYQAAVAAHKVAMAEWSQTIADALVTQIKDSPNVDSYRLSRGALQVTFTLSGAPDAPPVVENSRERFDASNEVQNAQRGIERLNRTIATLRMAADEAISITADDYAEYLG